jgi:hypothetical protein
MQNCRYFLCSGGTFFWLSAHSDIKQRAIAVERRIDDSKRERQAFYAPSIFSLKIIYLFIPFSQAVHQIRTLFKSG